MPDEEGERLGVPDKMKVLSREAEMGQIKIKEVNLHSIAIEIQNVLTNSYLAYLRTHSGIDDNLHHIPYERLNQTLTEIQEKLFKEFSRLNSKRFQQLYKHKNKNLKSIAEELGIEVAETSTKVVDTGAAGGTKG